MNLMRVTTCAILLLCGGMLAAQGEMALAKNYESYSAMFKNKKYKMVRSHGEFKAYAMKNKTLKKYFTEKSMNRFLMDLVFCKEGLVAFKYGYLVERNSEKEVFDALSRAFGWEPGPLGVDYAGYYCAAPDCKSTDDAICIGDNCGSDSIMTGKDFMDSIR